METDKIKRMRYLHRIYPFIRTAYSVYGCHMSTSDTYMHTYLSRHHRNGQCAFIRSDTLSHLNCAWRYTIQRYIVNEVYSWKHILVCDLLIRWSKWFWLFALFIAADVGSIVCYSFFFLRSKWNSVCGMWVRWKRPPWKWQPKKEIRK